MEWLLWDLYKLVSERVHWVLLDLKINPSLVPNIQLKLYIYIYIFFFYEEHVGREVMMSMEMIEEMRSRESMIWPQRWDTDRGCIFLSMLGIQHTNFRALQKIILINDPVSITHHTIFKALQILSFIHLHGSKY